MFYTREPVFSNGNITQTYDSIINYHQKINDNKYYISNCIINIKDHTPKILLEIKPAPLTEKICYKTEVYLNQIYGKQTKNKKILEQYYYTVDLYEYYRKQTPFNVFNEKRNITNKSLNINIDHLMSMFSVDHYTCSIQLKNLRAITSEYNTDSEKKRKVCFYFKFITYERMYTSTNRNQKQTLMDLFNYFKNYCVLK